MKRSLTLLLLGAFLPLALAIDVGLLTASVWAGDWPQFRYDAGRTAASPHELPAALQLRWTRTLPPPRPAFPHEVRLAYDASYEPVVLGRSMFVPSMVTDSVTALDTETGAQRWRYITGGPVRFAPVAWEGKVYFVSDDGYLYCLDADAGSLRWKFRGLPEGRRDRKVLGHGRLIALWPARGGPVLADGVVYFAAGLWPTEGVFVHALDAESGRVVWSNTDSDRIPESNWDHGIGCEAGLTPQGYLAIVGDKLVVPCGQQLPAFLDLKTGDRHTYTTGWGGRIGLPKGCWFVAGVGKYLSHAGDLYDITRPNDERLADAKPNTRNYKPMLYPGGWTRLTIERANQRELDSFSQPVLTPEVMYENDGNIVARDLTEVTLEARTPANIPPHRAKDEVPDNTGGVFRRLWELPSKLEVHIKAGRRLYVGGPGVVEAIDTTAGQEPKVVWRAEFEGTPRRMLAADDRLFIVTDEGGILAFAAPVAGEVTKHVVSDAAPPAVDTWTTKASAVLDATGARDGYALVLGIDRGRLIEELARQSDLHVIAVDEDADKVAALRERLCLAGLYGTRVSVLAGDPVTYPFPPYLASLVVSENPDALEQAGHLALAKAVFHSLRPYGGVACVWGPLADRGRIEQIVRDDAFPGAEVRQVGDLVLLARSGPLPGAADWSHAEANAASTGASQDDVRSPMSLLWFDAAQRWHKYPGQNQVRVAGGRLVLLEEGLLRASDVYTGRKLWEVELSEKPLDRQRIRYSRHRIWGPRPSLSPTTELVVLQDAIYLSDGTTCLVFDPATGKPAGHIDVPQDLDTPWANLRVCDDYLVGSRGRHVLCVNRRTGKLLWRVEAARDALYLAVGGNKVFCAELAHPRRVEDETRDGCMFALDLATGRRVWQRAGGARLRYSPSLDVVVTPTGVYRGSDGEPLPRQADAPQTRLVVTGNGLPKTGLPGLIAGTKLLTGNEETLLVYDLPSAEPIGKPLKWVRRGCTGTRASTHLLTTRYHGTSGWIDLDSREITPFLGIRPGCSMNNNLYPANGVLNMPNLTAGCTCNYAPVSAACVPAGVIKRDDAQANEQIYRVSEHLLEHADDPPAPAARPLIRAHAHNDYHHPRPLLDALDHGFCSVEVDVFLVDGKLLVGHVPAELKPERTLQALYLDPLRRRVQDNGGRVYRDGPPLTLMIDVKTDAGRTYAALAKVLSGYAKMLTSVRNGVVEQRAVNVIISGNRAEQAVADAPLRYVGIDGRLVDLDTQRPSHLVPLISDNWRSHFRWRGQGPMPDEERQKLRGIVEKAHEKARRVRFWATPDDPAVWRELVDANVDLLSTDDLPGLERFLRSQNPGDR